MADINKPGNVFGESLILFFYFGELLAPYLLDDDNPLVHTMNREPYFPLTNLEIKEDLSQYLSDNYKDNEFIDNISDKIYKTISLLILSKSC